MLINVPVTIVFDCAEIKPINPFGHGTPRLFTLRYDTEDTDALAQYCTGYPPRADAHWSIDAAGALFGLMPRSADGKIASRAARYPTDYCADAAEGERLEAQNERENHEAAQAQLGKDRARGLE